MASLQEVEQQILHGDLISPEELRTAAGEFRQQAGDDGGGTFIRWLAERQLLTDFQAEALTAGLSGPFMLGPYRVERHLTAGRLGHVFRAVHTEFELPVSLKVFPQSVTADPEKMVRLQREARVAIQLDHANLIRTFQIGRVGNVHYLALEDLPRESLLTRLDRKGRLPFSEACRLVRQAALGLEYLHQNGIIHRDVSPANMWITSGERLKLIEFGAARDELSFLDDIADAGGESAAAGGSLGTHEYMAPEQAQDFRSADARSDLYSLGCTLYHALAGRSPFVAVSPSEITRLHAMEAPPMVDLVVPEIPRGLADVVARLLAKSSDERIQTAGEVDWALQPYVGVGTPDADLAASKWTPEFLAFLRSVWAQPSSASESGSAPSELAPDAAEFLEWLTWQYLEKS